jgi:glycosyltransferase involved in cell wall biosynthesis
MKFSILISTKNRVDDLLYTLNKTNHLFNNNLNCKIIDDGSTDKSFEKIQENFPQIEVSRNEKSKGYIFCRNKMLNETDTDFCISLDDDAHILSENPIEIIEDYFKENPKCGVIAARIYWSDKEPAYIFTDEKSQIVQSFVGCGHVWRMKAWHAIPNYPEWFEFYGEEDFASKQLYKKDWQIHYVPDLFIQHRVDLKERAKSKKNFTFRYRRAIRADWFNYFLFFPLNKIPRKMVYSIVMQFKTKIFKGNFKVILPLFLALLDLIIFIPKLIKHRNAFAENEYIEYNKLSDAKIYWNPEK